MYIEIDENNIDSNASISLEVVPENIVLPAIATAIRISYQIRDINTFIWLSVTNQKNESYKKTAHENWTLKETLIHLCKHKTGPLKI